MAVLQDDIGVGIVALLDAAPFTTYIDGAAVGYTFDTNTANRALVRPLEAPSDPDQSYEDSGRFIFEYDVYFEFLDRNATQERITGIQDAIRKKLGDTGKALFTATSVTNADLNGGAFLVELGAPILEVGGEVRSLDELTDHDSPTLHYPVTVTGWQSYA